MASPPGRLDLPVRSVSDIRSQIMGLEDSARLAAIVAAQNEIVAEVDLDRVMTLITARSQALTGATGAKVQLVDGEHFVNVTGSGSAAQHRGLRYPLAGSLSGICVARGEVMHSEDTERDLRVNLEACRSVGARSLLLVPLIQHGEVLGVLATISDRPGAFEQRDIRTLELMAGLLGAALGTARTLRSARALVEERTAARDALAESERRFREAFDNAPIGMALVSSEDGFLQVNQALSRITGYDRADLLAWGLDALRLADRTRLLDGGPSATPPTPEPRAYGAYGPAGGRTQHLEGEGCYLRADGKAVWLRCTTSPVTDGEGRKLYDILHVQDVSGQRQGEARLRRLALHDPLTGLANRTLLGDRIAQALQRARRGAGLAAVLFVDLDRFKEVNDRFGHAAGDRVLVAVAERLTYAIRGQDTAARLGGDEFVIVCDGIAGREEATGIARRVAAALSMPHVVNGQTVALTASVGMVVARGCETVTELIGDADAAMYREKRDAVTAP